MNDGDIAKAAIDVAGARDPNLVELNRLFRADYARLVSKVARITHSLEDAEDVAQAAFIRMLDMMPTIQLRSSRAYLYRTAHNLAIDHVRRNKVARRIFDPVDLNDHQEAMGIDGAANDVAATCQNRETMRQVSTQLDRLPPKCRQAFVLSKVEESTYPEIAREMNLSVSMIEKYLSRALSQVRENVHYEIAA